MRLCKLNIRLLAAACALMLLSGVAAAGEVYELDENTSVVGELEAHTVSDGDSLHEVALAAGLGYREIVDANSSVDPWVPEDGTVVRVPKFWVLPDGPRRGIVVNLAEMRLYHYFNKDGKTFVATYPVGIGREAFDTPQGIYRISHKMKDPAWIVPESIREEKPDLPAVVPPGPDNPLGSYALRLSGSEYLLHGTNRPFGIGRRVSHGCIRMYPEDIEELYGAAKTGERVRVVYQPVKAGERDGKVYVEVHMDYLKEGEALWAETTRMLSGKGLLEGTNSGLLHFALEARTGVPFVVSPEGNAKTPEVARAESEQPGAEPPRGF